MEHLDHLEHQDWKTIVVKAKNDKSYNNKPKLSDEKLKDIKLHKQVEDGDLKHKKIPDNIRKEIQTKRCSLNLTQKQLAQKCNLQVSVINEIETGKALYNPQHINKLKRILHIK